MGSSKMTSDCLFAEIEKHIINSASRKIETVRILDAGTGEHSLKWLLEFAVASSWDFEVVAVTGSKAQAEILNKLLDQFQFSTEQHSKKKFSIAFGNWENPDFLKGQTFDFVIADYLVGAMDGFSPYLQDVIFTRLKRHLGDSGSIFVIGLQPFSQVDVDTEGQKLIIEMARVRDSCILLAGHTCYREYPLSWIQRNLEKSGFVVLSTSHFSNLYDFRTINRQLSVARAKLDVFYDASLADSMCEYIKKLEEKAAIETSKSKIKFGFDYLVHAKI